jgi:hypothetical protein
MTTRPTREDVIAWLNDRLDNCHRIAAIKEGRDRDGWMEDAAYFSEAVIQLSAPLFPTPAEPLADQGGDEAEVAFERIAEPDWWLSEIGVARRNSFLAGYRAAQAKARPREPTEDDPKGSEL